MASRPEREKQNRVEQHRCHRGPPEPPPPCHLPAPVPPGSAPRSPLPAPPRPGREGRQKCVCSPRRRCCSPRRGGMRGAGWRASRFLWAPLATPSPPTSRHPGSPRSAGHRGSAPEGPGGVVPVCPVDGAGQPPWTRGGPPLGFLPHGPSLGVRYPRRSIPPTPRPRPRVLTSAPGAAATAGAGAVPPARVTAWAGGDLRLRARGSGHSDGDPLVPGTHWWVTRRGCSVGHRLPSPGTTLPAFT